MKNRAKKIIAVGLGVCFWALWFVFLFFVTKPYTEQLIIWLPNNYELENTMQNEVVSIMPPIDNPQFNETNEIFYSEIGMESFKRIVNENKNEKKVAIKIEDVNHSNFYRIIYQIKYCIDNNKSLIVLASECHECNKIIFSELRFNDKTKKIFLKYDRHAIKMYTLLFFGLIVIWGLVFLYTEGLNMWSKRDKN